MADVVDKKKRSEIMALIRSKNTKIEKTVFAWLKRNKYQFIKHDKNLAGKPDIVLPNYKTVIFIHGCFWHHHKNCPKARFPKTKKKYWIPKIEKNVTRDLRNAARLRRMGWHVLTVWECQVEKDVEKVMRRVERRYLYPILRNHRN